MENGITMSQIIAVGLSSAAIAISSISLNYYGWKRYYSSKGEHSSRSQITEELPMRKEPDAVYRIIPFNSKDKNILPFVFGPANAPCDSSQDLGKLVELNF